MRGPLTRHFEVAGVIRGRSPCCEPLHEIASSVSSSPSKQSGCRCHHLVPGIALVRGRNVGKTLCGFAPAVTRKRPCGAPGGLA